ncbi:unnamed protein product [Protopolystoma xenopodis]|uniref:Uncharacterized protein n=1 Tax=Protopolystoma xenopodis TaxID=117903 RepID=A0A3S5CTX5_9PLAT|nr:unnamed protein product [Protopolystoma xenopodis]
MEQTSAAFGPDYHSSRAGGLSLGPTVPLDSGLFESSFAANESVWSLREWPIRGGTFLVSSGSLRGDLVTASPKFGMTPTHHSGDY